MVGGRRRLIGGAHPGRPAPATTDRAQTTLDFMIGAGVFLLTVAFVLGVIPGMIDPFNESQETTLVADRLATQVSEGMLAEPDQPTILNETCMNAFFNDSLGSGAGCPVSFDAGEDDLSARLGVDGRYSVNVSIERNTTGGPGFDILYTDGETVGATGHTRLAAGRNPPVTSSVVVASRTAFVDGKDVRVVVRVW